MLRHISFSVFSIERKLLFTQVPFNLSEKWLGKFGQNDAQFRDFLGAGKTGYPVHESCRLGIPPTSSCTTRPPSDNQIISISWLEITEQTLKPAEVSDSRTLFPSLALG
jgi:hypothetical protein